MIAQRGLIASLPLYGLIVAVAVAGGLGIALKIQSGRLETAKAELELCKSQYNQALASIQRQNEAVEALAKASAQAKARSERALKAATQALRVSR